VIELGFTSSPTPGLKGKLFFYVFYRKLMRAAKSPGLHGTVPSSTFLHQNNICMSAIVVSQYGATTRDKRLAKEEGGRP
jgi:hypothetical protein